MLERGLKLKTHKIIWTLSILVFVSAGCGSMSEKTVVKPAQAPQPLQNATKDELIQQYNQQANAIHSINAAVTMQLTAGTAYTGTIEQYHEVTGFILAQKPADIRVIGQVPVVGKNIFDMESDGTTFRIFVPSKNQFIVGPANLDRPSSKPVENLRPQHLLDAIFWQPIPAGVPVLFEQATENNNSYYVLTILAMAHSSSTENSGNGSAAGLRIDRKIWFARTDLHIDRIEAYDASGKVVSDIRYTKWQNYGDVKYPSDIALNRPANDYQIQIGITKLTANEPITADRFELKQPDGTELVQVNPSEQEARP